MRYTIDAQVAALMRLAEMENERHNQKYQENRFHRLGAMVFDAVTLLEANAEMNARLCPEFEAKRIEISQRYSTKVAVHALRTVLEALNDESMHWRMQKMLGQ